MPAGGSAASLSCAQLQLSSFYLIQLHVHHGRSQQPQQAAHLVPGRRGHLLVTLHWEPAATTAARAPKTGRAARGAPWKSPRASPAATSAPPNGASHLIQQPQIWLSVSSRRQWLQTLGKRCVLCQWTQRPLCQPTSVRTFTALPRGPTHGSALIMPRARSQNHSFTQTKFRSYLHQVTTLYLHQMQNVNKDVLR